MVYALFQKHRTLLKAYLYFGIAFEVLTLFLDFVLFEHGDYLETLVYFFFSGEKRRLENIDIRYSNYEARQGGVFCGQRCLVS